MKLFPSEPDIGEATGFTTQNDIFKRRDFAKGITNLLAGSDDPLVIALDSGWGTGKTVFLKSWAGELRKEGFPVVMFDAFKHDYMEDAFAAIAGAIITLAEEKAPPSKVAELKSAAISAAKILMKGALKVSVKLATLGALDGDELKDAAEAIADEAPVTVDKLMESLITKQKEQQSLLQKFTDTLATLPKLLSSDNEETRPLIFIIDELDRCRPTFALELLEKIKHFFSVPNVHFILGVHMGQLQNSVKAQYGLVDDPRTYLEKFISVTLRFDDQGERSDESTVARYVAYLCNEMGIERQDGTIAFLLRELIPGWSKKRNLNMRTVQKIIAHFVLITTAFGRTTNYPRELVIMLCYLKVAHPITYEKIRSNTQSFAEVGEALSIDLPVNCLGTPQEEIVHFFFNQNADDSIITERLSKLMLPVSRLNMPAWTARKYVEVLS